MTVQTNKSKRKLATPESTEQTNSDPMKAPRDQTQGSKNHSSIETWIISSDAVILIEKKQNKAKYQIIEVSTSGDLLAAWIIGLYLVIHIVLLSYLAFLTWLASDWNTFAQLFPGLSSNPAILGQPVGAQKFYTFQTVALASCAAGIGGAVFMVRNFYLNFAYGRENAKQPVNYLKNKEIPRYILLPFSSFVLGPMTLALLRTGSLISSGLTTEKEIPLFSVVSVSFVLGFTYHDTLDFMRNLSRQIFKRNNNEKATKNHIQPIDLFHPLPS